MPQAISSLWKSFAFILNNYISSIAAPSQLASIRVIGTLPTDDLLLEKTWINIPSVSIPILEEIGKPIDHFLRKRVKDHILPARFEPETESRWITVVRAESMDLNFRHGLRRLQMKKFREFG